MAQEQEQQAVAGDAGTPPATSDAPDGAGAVAGPDQVLQQLQALPPEACTYSCTALRCCLEAQQEWVQLYKAFAHEAPTTPEEVDHSILLFLKQAYLLVSAVPGALAFDALENVMAGSGLLTPFVAGIREDGTLELGVPTTNALCDNAQELIRLAGAAVCCYYSYVNFPSRPGMLPSDDACLLFSTIALKSCVNADAAAVMASQLDAAGGLVTLAQVRWLLHYIRAHLMGYLGAVSHMVGDPQKHKECLLAQQADFLALLKAVPDNPAGYGLYARACLQFQQMGAAQLFARKGAVVAERQAAGLYVGQLAAMRGVALALGGGGSAAAAGRTFQPSEVRTCVAEARARVADEQAVLPEVYHYLLSPSLEPEISILEQNVLPQLSAAAASGAGTGEAAGGGGGGGVDGDGGDSPVPVLDMLYATRLPPLPRGALHVEMEGDEEGEGLGVEGIPEGAEGEEGEEGGGGAGGAAAAAAGGGGEGGLAAARAAAAAVMAAGQGQGQPAGVCVGNATRVVRGKAKK